MTANKLKLNDDITESLLTASKRTHFPNPPPISIHIGNTDIPFSSQAKNLDVTLPSNLSMEKHVTNVCRSAYVEIGMSSNIRHYLTTDATKKTLPMPLFCPPQWGAADAEIKVPFGENT